MSVVHPNTRGNARPRGAAYVIVLVTAMILTVLGLSALTLARIENHVTRNHEAVVKARFHGASVVELAIQRINDDPDWRTTYTNDQWTSPETAGGVTFAYKLVDEGDGDLADDPADSARLYAKATVGPATRIYSVLVSGSANPSEILTNGDMEHGTVAWTEWEADNAKLNTEDGGDGPHSGALYIKVNHRDFSDSGIAQDVSARVVKGQGYYVSLWVRMKTDPESVVVTMTANASAGTIESSFTSPIVGTTWTQVTGALTPTWNGTINTVHLRVSTTSTDQDFYIDDASLNEGNAVLQPVMQPVAGTWRREVQ